MRGVQICQFPQFTVKIVKVARLQNEFWHELFYPSYEFLTKNALKCLPGKLSVSVLWVQKIPQSSRQFPSEKIKQITDELLQEWQG